MSHFLNVLTQKGLNFVLRNSETPEIRPAVRLELQRRARLEEARDERADQVAIREVDGYERDA